MIRYLQKLKNKKAFTLVELIVVIAIIAVLAAIIIPITSGFVTRAKITSANATAALIKKNVEPFMMELNFKGVGLKLGKDKIAQIMFMINDGVWTVKAETKPWDFTKNQKIADADGSYVFNDHKNWWKSSNNFTYIPGTTNSGPTHLLALTELISEILGGIKNGFVEIYFQDQKCKGAIYIPDCAVVWPNGYTPKPGEARPCIVNNPTDKDRPGMTNFWPFKGDWPFEADEKIWPTGIPGIDKDGYIVGTSPIIGLKGYE